jgi:hypothetical protein
MLSFRNTLLLVLALVLGWVFLSQRGDKMKTQQEEATLAGASSASKQDPKGKFGLVESEAFPDSSYAEKTVVRVPTQEARPESLTREPETSPESVPVVRSADRRLQHIEKSISDYDDDNFDERMLNDEALLDQFGRGNVPVPVGRRGTPYVDDSDDSSSTSRSDSKNDPYEGYDEDSSYPSAR